MKKIKNLLFTTIFLSIFLSSVKSQSVDIVGAWPTCATLNPYYSFNTVTPQFYIPPTSSNGFYGRETEITIAIQYNGFDWNDSYASSAFLIILAGQYSTTYEAVSLNVRKPGRGELYTYTL